VVPSQVAIHVWQIPRLRFEKSKETPSAMPRSIFVLFPHPARAELRTHYPPPRTPHSPPRDRLYVAPTFTTKALIE
jgi:hypothetical protein